MQGNDLRRKRKVDLWRFIAYGNADGGKGCLYFSGIYILLLLRSLLYFENLIYRVFIIDFIPIFCLSRFGDCLRYPDTYRITE